MAYFHSKKLLACVTIHQAALFGEILRSGYIYPNAKRQHNIGCQDEEILCNKKAPGE